MQFIKLIRLSIVLGLLSTSANAQESKFAALAIDKSNGFYYGWAYDHPSLEDAEKRAVEECAKRGGICSVVLSWSGAGCGVYRTTKGNAGTAYGWGIAKTQAAADKIATQEALKRSNGISPVNFVFACNSGTKESLKVIKNDITKEFKTIKIGNQVWMAENLNISIFRNGESIPEAKNDTEWIAAGKSEQAIWRYLEDSAENGKRYGKLYNWFTVNDSRGLCPQGFHVPSIHEWRVLFEAIGDPSTAAGKLKSKTGWNKNNGTDDYGFNALPGGNAGSGGGFNGIGGVANFWSATSKDYKYVFDVALYSFKQSYKESSGYPRTAGEYVRCVKD